MCRHPVLYVLEADLEVKRVHNDDELKLKVT